MHGFRTGCRRRTPLRGAAVWLLMTALLFTTTGVSCDDIPFATSTFRDASLDQISTGVKGIVDGIIDGIFAVLEQAGDGGNTTSN